MGALSLASDLLDMAIEKERVGGREGNLEHLIKSRDNLLAEKKVNKENIALVNLFTDKDGGLGRRRPGGEWEPIKIKGQIRRPSMPRGESGVSF